MSNISKQRNDHVQKILSDENPEHVVEKLQGLLLSNSKTVTLDALEFYAKHVDDVKGINNYAKEIKEKVKYSDNVSDTWVTSITKEKLLNFIKENQTNTDDKMSHEEIDKLRQIAQRFKKNPPLQLHFKMKTDLTNSNNNNNNNNNKENNNYNHNKPEIKAAGKSFTFKGSDQFQKNKSNVLSMSGVRKDPIGNTKGSLSFGEIQSNNTTPMNAQPKPTNQHSSTSFTSYHPTNILKRTLSHITTPFNDTKVPKTINKLGNNSHFNVQYSETDQSNHGESMDNLPFRSALDQLDIDNRKKNNPGYNSPYSQYGTNKKSLGTRKGARSDFIPPTGRTNQTPPSNRLSNQNPQTSKNVDSGLREKYGDIMEHDSLKQFQPEMIDLIMSEIMDNGKTVTFDDIAGLESAKKTLNEIVIHPMQRPDIFTGLRRPPKGLLLFGPPGTGKTLIGKCIACHSKSTFFSISASSLTSKWVGEGEKMVKALFVIARLFQPSVVFIDEIDSLLSQRSESEHESSRRIKTEFLIQLDGVATSDNERLLLVGATNRPQEIDEAARRRFVKRLYIPLPSPSARGQLVQNLMKTERHNLTETDIQKIINKSAGYSGADMANLCREAALGPVRELPFERMQQISIEELRCISVLDFEEALKCVRPSVSEKDLDVYINWNKTYGSY